MTNEEYLVRMTYLQKYFGHKLDDEINKLYWNRLKNVDTSTFSDSVKNIIDTFRPTQKVPFPLIVDFLEQSGETGDNAAERAIATIRDSVMSVGAYRSVDFGDPALHATIKSFGGWIAICGWGDEQWQMNRRNFIQAYKSALTRKEDVCHLSGISEKANGYLADPVSIVKFGKFFEADKLEDKTQDTEQAKENMKIVSTIAERMTALGYDPNEPF